MKIVLSVGHVGKVSNPRDRGAEYQGSRESDLVLIYALSAFQHLEKQGHLVYLLTYGDYSERKKFCRKIGAELHLQLHLNSAEKPGDYALIEYRKSNENKCSALAEIMKAEFTEELPVKKTAIWTMKKGDNGYVCCMSDIPSLLLEPLFLNNEKHYESMMDGDMLFTIGKAITNSILEWIGGD